MPGAGGQRAGGRAGCTGREAPPPLLRGRHLPRQLGRLAGGGWAPRGVERRSVCTGAAGRAAGPVSQQVVHDETVQCIGGFQGALIRRTRSCDSRMPLQASEGGNQMREPAWRTSNSIHFGTQPSIPVCLRSRAAAGPSRSPGCRAESKLGLRCSSRAPRIPGQQIVALAIEDSAARGGSRAAASNSNLAPRSSTLLHVQGPVFHCAHHVSSCAAPAARQKAAGRAAAARKRRLRLEPTAWQSTIRPLPFYLCRPAEHAFSVSRCAYLSGCVGAAA